MISTFWKSLIAATCVGVMMFHSFAFLSWRDAVRRQSELDEWSMRQAATNALITELALAKLEGRTPSFKAQEYWKERTEDSAPRLELVK